MNARTPLVTAFVLVALALAGWAAEDNLGGGEDSLVSVRLISKFTIVNNTTTPADSNSSTVLEGTLKYNCGGALPLLTLAKDNTVDLDCTSASILYQVPGQIGPYRLDFSCETNEREKFTFSGSGSGVSSQSSCESAAD